MRLLHSILTLALLTAPALAGDLYLDLGRGSVRVHIPSSYDPAIPMPLVMTLHGYGASGAGQESYFQLAPLSESRGFLYLYPNGTLDGGGSRFWNATDACCNFYGSTVDDSGYLRALLDEVRAQLSVDPRRVHILGHSNGGFMAYRMACEHADLIASIASLAGASFDDASFCAPSEPVHVLQIHGTQDSTILFGGGSLVGNTYPSASGSAERWATYDGCALVPDTSAPNINLVANIAGMETTVTRWRSACDEGGSAELWTMVGAGHVPSLSNPFAGLVIDYLLSHPKPGAGESYCSATPNSSGAPALMHGEGSASISAADLTLVAEPVPAVQNGLFYYGPEELALPFGNGLRCVGSGAGALWRLPIRSSGAAGRLRQPISYSGSEAQLAAGTTWKFQAWFRDPAAGGSAFDLSDGLSIVFRP